VLLIFLAVPVVYLRGCFRSASTSNKTLAGEQVSPVFLLLFTFYSKPDS
jgi:hypothetical protein